MNKAQVLKLKPGDIVEYGNYTRLQDIDKYEGIYGYHYGTIQYVTPKGGVLIRENTGTHEEWHPYSHLTRVMHGMRLRRPVR